MKNPSLLLTWPLVVLGLLVAVTPLRAQELHAFEVNYEAHYGNLEAAAARSLQFDAATQRWRLNSVMTLQLLGATVTEINESSEFHWRDGLPAPHAYLFQQRGVGKRSRSLEFTQDNHVQFAVNEERGTLALSGAAYDDLNSFLVLREQLRQGKTDIVFTVVDRNELKPYRYQVIGEETLQTPVGAFKTIHVNRIREQGNARTTDLWLAADHEYLLLKLVQDEPSGDTITLELEDATLDGKPLRGD